jgi:hypothetical protein
MSKKVAENAMKGWAAEKGGLCEDAYSAWPHSAVTTSASLQCCLAAVRARVSQELSPQPAAGVDAAKDHKFTLELGLAQTLKQELLAQCCSEECWDSLSWGSRGWREGKSSTGFATRR